ncbi:MAG: aminoglycoside phosphotransferase family protein [Methylosarcina sp.]
MPDSHFTLISFGRITKLALHIMLEDIRILTLLDWLEHDLLLTVAGCEPASSDASFRRYFRVKVPEGSFIVMDAPPEKENISSFIKVANILRASEVHVPAIFAQNLRGGFLLLEDFGSQCLLDRLNAANVDAFYHSAMESLFKLQVNTVLAEGDLPAYDAGLLNRELAIFDEWFLQQLLEIDLPAHIREPLHELLVGSALAQPRVCVHRDFHSRNLMALESDSPGVLDFQDAVIGPIIYDLVSLLRDCYIAWPDAKIELWLAGYYRRLLQHNLLDCSLDQFKRWFDLMGMQRHLKAIGIFSRLKLRDGKHGYIKDIPRTLNYVLEQARVYPELAEFSRFLQNRVLPLQFQTA